MPRAFDIAANYYEFYSRRLHFAVAKLLSVNSLRYLGVAGYQPAPQYISAQVLI